MAPDSFSILPPIVILVLGYITRRVLFSLACGIYVGSFLATDYSFLDAFTFSLKKIWDISELSVIFGEKQLLDCWNLLICSFTIILGIVITLIHHSGGVFAYESYIKSRLRNKKQVESSSLILSSCLCIDDYFSSLTVGSVMRSITDAFRIPRAKLAFLVDSMAAPLAILCPVSSWVAAIVGFLRENGIRIDRTDQTQIIASPFLTYLNVIPYVFYSFIIIFSSWYIVLKRASFGSMKKHEDFADKTGNVFGGQKPPSKMLKQDSIRTKKPSLLDFFIPVSILISGIVLGILYSGNWILLGGHLSIIDALRESSAANGLFIGGSYALVLIIFYLFGRRKLTPKQLPKIFKDGINLMLISCCVLILAWTLGAILKDHLATGEYLAHSLLGHVSPKWVPGMFFCVSVLISFGIGSAWGTAALMFPIGIQFVLSILKVQVPIALEEVSLIIPTLAAILSGCVAGDHITPISDTTIMTSTSTGMNHADHVETQMTYAVPLIFVTAFVYFLHGFLSDMGSVFAYFASLGAAALIAILYFKCRLKFARSNDSAV